MKNTKMIVGIIVAIAVVVLGVWFFTGRGNDGTTNGSLNQLGSDGNSLRSLMAMNQSQRCTFESGDADNVSSGVAYFGNGKMRGDFTLETASMTQNSHVIVDEEGSMYMWIDGQAQGYKIIVDDSVAAEDVPNGTSSDLFDFDQDVDYDCKSWNVNKSKFELPADVDFVSFSDAFWGCWRMRCRRRFLGVMKQM